MSVHRRNLYILCFTIFLSSASWNQIAPFMPQFLRELGVTHSLTTWSGIVFAVQPLAAIVMYPFWGHMGDRMGRKAMVIRAGFCIAAVYFGMSVCRSAWQLALLRLVNGALSGFVPGSLALIATNTPDELSGRYVATAQSASAVGTILGPVVGGVLAAMVGRRGSMRLSSLIVLAATILVILLVREKEHPAAGKGGNVFADLYRVAFLPPMPVILWVSLLGAAVTASIQPFLTLHLENLPGQRAEWLTGAVYALPGVAFALFARAWSRLGEKLPRPRVIALGFAGIALSFFCLAWIRSFWLFGAVYFIYGVFVASLTPNIAAHVAEDVPVAMRGRAYGLMQGANPAGAFLAPMAAGLIGRVFGLRGVLLAFGLVAAGGALLLRRWRPGGASPQEAPAKSRGLASTNRVG